MRTGIWTLAVAFAVAATTAAAQESGVDLSKAKLRNPSSFTEKAPETFKATFDTSQGAFTIEVHRAWAPNGADRFFNLVKNGFYDDCRFFRVLDGFMAQIGMNGNPAVQSAWATATIQDDPVKQSNKRGFVTFAKSAAPNSRSTQIFINYRDNSTLDRQVFAPFGEVTSGMEVVDKLYSGYGEGEPGGKGPGQGKIMAQGNAYLTKDFPKLDYVKKATIEK
ncbi:MAG TPA: peptidylprolyl isomerase [Vicinamibacterales bacterium]|jgi:peptidyl-prolyl cis-trans isomerase A (cyclophilin A)|nr:peptidylprolyl isomerase [Vicinamibacterales bacterium]